MCSWMCRLRELKLKENVATSRTRSVATVANRTGTSRSLSALPLARQVARLDAIIGLSSPREEPVRALAGCARSGIPQERLRTDTERDARHPLLSRRRTGRECRRKICRPDNSADETTRMSTRKRGRETDVLPVLRCSRLARSYLVERASHCRCTREPPALLQSVQSIGDGCLSFSLAKSIKYS